MKYWMAAAALAGVLAAGCAGRDTGRGGSYDTGEEVIQGTRTNGLGHGPDLHPGTRLDPGLRSGPSPDPSPQDNSNDSDSGLFLPRNKHRSFQI